MAEVASQEHPVGGVQCPVCNMALVGMEEVSQHQHVNRCLDEGPRPTNKETLQARSPLTEITQVIMSP